MLAGGTKLGPYEVVAPLGAGGMGEVYRARDTRLGREVAIKVLPAAFARDADRLRRFEQEARAVSALNHPNILTIFDIGAHEGAPYVVSELLEGQTLRERLNTGALPQRRTVDYAVQFAHGLAAAHDKGITHRDLKPENLFLTRDERLKILDFGLAKLTEPASNEVGLTNAPTTPSLTQPGAVLGTVGYMSPEQARGAAADHRSDLFSFGVILYEMLSGRRAFQRDSAVETLAAIINADPPELEHAGLERIVRHSLEKAPERRFQSARDLAFALEALSGSSVSAVGGAARQPRRLPWAAGVAAALMLLVGLAAGYWLHSRQSASPNWSGTLLSGPAAAFEPRVSPDGRTMAFQAIVDNQTQVAVIEPQSGNWTVLTKEHFKGAAQNLCWSKDGSKIYYERFVDYPGGIYSISALGGEEHLLLEDAGRPEVLPDGSLVLTRINAQRQMQLYRFWPQNGRLDPLPAAVTDNQFTRVRSFPDGLEVAFFGRPLHPGDQPGDAADHAYVIELASGRLRRLYTGTAPDPILSVQAVDPVRNMVLTTARSGDLIQLAAIPRSGSGSTQKLLSLTGVTWYSDVGPDGSLYADQIQRPEAGLRFPVAGGSPEQLPSIGDFTVFTAGTTAMLLLPDGRTLVARPYAGQNQLVASAPGKAPQPVIQTDEESDMPATLLPDGQLAFALGSGAQRSLGIASLTDGRVLRRLAETAGATLDSLAASADGKTLYYVNAKAVWAIPAAGGRPRRIAAADSATVHPNGQELVIQLNESRGARLVRVPSGGGEPRPIPLQIPDGLRLTTNPLTPNAISRDGRMVVTVASQDSWFYQPAVVDLATGKLQKIPLRFDGDVFSLNWASDGRIVASGQPMHAAIWRFRPVK